MVIGGGAEYCFTVAEVVALEVVGEVGTGVVDDEQLLIIRKHNNNSARVINNLFVLFSFRMETCSRAFGLQLRI
jgi:hypothetical protein